MSNTSNSSKLPVIARYALGAGFFVFGLNGFLHFLPAPAEPASANAFLGALFSTGYMFPLIKGTETLAGALLLSNRFVPLALTILAPVLVNIVAFHAFLAPAALPVPLVLLALELYLARVNRATYAPMLRAREPEESSRREYHSPTSRVPVAT